jgi:hypothetical protein
MGTGDIVQQEGVAMNFSANGYLAVTPPKLNKIESRVSSGGIAINATRVDLINLSLIFNYSKGELYLTANKDSVLVHGDSGARPWAKRVYEWQGKQFVLMPESELVGYIKE